MKHPGGFCSFGSVAELLLDSGDCISDRRHGLGMRIESVASSRVLVGSGEVVGTARRRTNCGEKPRGVWRCFLSSGTRRPFSVNNQPVDIGATVSC
jgi:hypothetical protein